MGTGRDECLLGVVWMWGVKDKYENRTELLDICYMLSRNLEFCAGGILLHDCCPLDMDLLRQLTDCDGRFLVRHYLIDPISALAYDIDICMTLALFLLSTSSRRLVFFLPRSV